MTQQDRYYVHIYLMQTQRYLASISVRMEKEKYKEKHFQFFFLELNIRMFSRHVFLISYGFKENYY